MRSNKQSKTGTIKLRKIATRKIKRRPVDSAVSRQSSDAILSDLKHPLSEIYDLNAVGLISADSDRRARAFAAHFLATCRQRKRGKPA
jgi:hypothetical protein